MSPAEQAFRRVTWSAAVLVLLAIPVHAEESRFADVRLIVGRDWNGGFDEANGALILDNGAQRLRFEAGGRSLLDVRFDQLRAARYEQSKYPPRSFRRSGFYLTLHYIRDTGDSGFEVLRLPGGAAADLLSVFERDTDISIERGPAATSFLGLPVHLALGSRIEVTSESGVRVRGRVVRLSDSSLDLGASGWFDVASVREIKVRDRLWEGVAMGTGASVVPAAFLSFGECINDPCSGFWVLSSHGWAVVAAGAIVGAAIDAGRTRHAYRRLDRRNSSGVQWSPVVGNNQRGVLVSLQF